MNKTIKKIVAFGTAGLMLASIGAAATLSDYPAPFVQNGVFVGKIVIGENAKTVDLLGAMDISASLQRLSSTPTGTTGGGQTATAAGGYLFSESHDLVLGDQLSNVTTVVDDTDLPDLLASGTVEADDGSTYDYDVEIDLPSDSGTKVSADINQNSLDDTYTEPVVYYDLGTGAGHLYDVLVDFTDAWSLNEDSADTSGINEGSTTIELFGRAYTFDPNNFWDDQYLTLYGSDTTLTVAKGETKTITYNGKEYSVEILGGNSDDSSAIIRIGSDTETVKKGNSKTIGGLPIYVKNVFVSNIGGEDVSVQLFLGSNKIEIEYATSGGEVKLNGKVLDEVTVSVDRSGTQNWEEVNSLTFAVTPQDANNEVEALLPGQDYVDPLFGSFKFNFVGAKDLMSGKEALKFEQSGKKMNIVFTPRGASTETTIPLLEDNALYENFFGGATLTNMQKDDMFLFNEFDGEPDKAVTHLLQITRVKDGNDQASDTYEISVRDLSFDTTYTVTKCKALSSKIALYPEETTDPDNVTFTDNVACSGTDVPNVPFLYTNAGASAEFVMADGSTAITDAGDINATQGFFSVDEDAQDDADSSTKTTFLAKYAWDSTDDAYSLTVSDPGTAEANIGNNDNVEYYLSQFGTYVLEDTDTAPYKYVRMYIPDKEITYDMFLLPVNSEVTVTSTTGGSSVILNPLSVGIAIMDSQATLGAKPYIVVGGPCANTVAAALMQNPTDCAAGFTEGKAKIKLFSDQNALLVAGYSAQDTQGASRVLANYQDYSFSGSELEVTTTNLNNLLVQKVQ